MHRFWKWSKLIAPAPKPDRLLTPVRKQNLSPTTLYICMLKIREVKHSCRSWYSEISNSFFSILLSLLHSSIVLVQFEFALFLSALINFLSCLFYYIFPLQSIHCSRTLLWFIICCVLPTPPPHSAPSFFFHSLTISTLRGTATTLCLFRPAWQGTDLMHNHVLADVDRSCMDLPGRRSSVSRPELSSDLSEDSDYDSIWTSHSYRMGSVPRKSCISHQN